MPKIIENLEGRLKEAARQQIRELGYSAVTIRSVASACGIGVGTVYNYYPSKDELLASWLLDEWMTCVARINCAAAEAEEPRTVACCIHEQLVGYALENRDVFQDEAAMVSCGGALRRYHKLLRSNLAQPLRRFCNSDFQAEFVSESLLTWSLAGVEFEVIWSELCKFI